MTSRVPWGRAVLCGLLAAGVAILVVTATGQTTVPADPDVEILAAKGIASDAQSINKYLLGFKTGGDEKVVKQLIAQLGSDSWKAREEATDKLINLPVLPEKQLTDAAKSPDAEVANRAKLVLERAKGVSNWAILRSALDTIARNRLKGAAAGVIHVIPACDGSMLPLATEALSATAGEGDDKLLREALKDQREIVRSAAMQALYTTQGAKAAADFRGMLNDASEAIRLSAARDLAQLGDRACLKALGAMLSSKDPDVRSESNILLVSLTGKEFSFVAYDEDAPREKAAGAWRDWIEKQGATAKLNHPLKSSAVDNERVLACLWTSGQVVEMDLQGRRLVTIDLPSGATPWGVQGLGDGRYLVGLFGTKAVHEYDAKGKVLWKIENLPGGPMHVERLANGNTLVAASDANQVLEYSRDGKLVWSLKTPGRCIDARRLKNGNTLICLHKDSNKVYEVTKDGKEVWAYQGQSDLQTAQRLDSGSTLIVFGMQQKVIEVDKGGTVVWTKQCSGAPFDAQRIANGNTLIGQQDGLFEYDKSGNLVKRYINSSISRLHRY